MKILALDLGKFNTMWCLLTSILANTSSSPSSTVESTSPPSSREAKRGTQLFSGGLLLFTLR